MFNAWLSGLLGHSEDTVKVLLEDQTALHFLMAWSFFESKCHKGFLRFEQIEAFAKRKDDEKFWPIELESALKHFHDRYQNLDRRKNLLHGQSSNSFVSILQKPLDSLRVEEKIFFLVLVVYRFRNNIFHGNKGVTSWLQFSEQINLCIDVMQVFVSHEERISPTMKTPSAS